jgi:transposase
LGSALGRTLRDLPERYGPYTTCYNRFNRWRKAGGSGTGSTTPSRRPTEGNIQMIDTSVVRMHQHAANVKKGVKFNLALKIAKFALYPALLMAALLVTASVIASTAAIHGWDW